MLADAFTRSFLAFGLYLILLYLVFRSRIIRDQLKHLFAPAAAAGWRIAAIIVVIEVVVIVPFFIDDPAVILELSLFNLVMSFTAAAMGGLAEEVGFRGFVITRLAEAGYRRVAQALLSGTLFGIIHFNWGLSPSDANIFATLAPFFGTFALGIGLAFAFIASGRRLLPVVTAHCLINIIIQPGLVLSYFG